MLPLAVRLACTDFRTASRHGVWKGEACILHFTAFALLAAGTALPEERYPVAQAFVAAQLAMMSSAGRALQQTGLRIGAGEPSLAAMVCDRQDFTDQARRLEDAPAGESGADRRIARRGEIDSLHDDIALIDRAPVEAFPCYTELAAPEPLPQLVTSEP